MTFFWLMALLVFLLGSAVGSFLNVVLYRSLHGEDWVKGKSRCESCGKAIAWHENIPLLSYLYLRGRCAHCKALISPIHPGIELLTGTLFLWWYLEGLPQFTAQTSILPIVQPLFWLVIGVIAVAIIISDLEQLIIPRWSVALLTVLTLVYRIGLIITGEMQVVDFWLAIIWAIMLTLGFFGLWSLTHGRGFGFGDVQLAFPLALLLGSWQRIVVGIFLAFFSGALVGVALILFKKKRFGQVIPFGPFLLLGTALSLRWGWQLWDSYINLIVK